jgi:acetyl esterase/lipase
MTRRVALLGIAALTGACTRLGFLAANTPTLFGGYTRIADLPYGADPRQRLDVYLPPSPAADTPALASPRPMIVFWHGGRWSFGNKNEYRFVGAALAELGYVVVLPNYRHYPQVKMPGFMDDAARAAQWAWVHAPDYRADPQRFYLMGHSAGAHMAALLALDPHYLAGLGEPIPRIEGVIGLSGPYDFLPLTEADTRDMFGPPALYPASQPINFVHPGAPSMLLVVGLSDTTVLPKNTLNFAAALGAAGVPVTLRTYPKLGHGDTVAALSLPARHRAPVLADIRTFVQGGPKRTAAAGSRANTAATAAE